MIKKIILWILVISLAAFIFILSHQEAKESDNLSLSVGEKIVEFMVKINIIDIPASENGEKEIELLAEKINGHIRTFAHYFLYLLFGALVTLLVFCYKNGKKAIYLILIICLLYAVSDEIHQYFIPGRSCQLIDIITDFSGSITGLLVIMLLHKPNTTID